MDAATARKVIEVAVKHDGYEGDVPSEDKQLIADGEQLLAMIQGAYTNGVRSDAALELLRAAGADPDTYPDAYAGHEGAKPDTAPAEKTTEPAPEAASGVDIAPDSIESIFPGYDDQKVKQIKEAITESAASGDLTEEEFRLIQAYEEANEGRKGILELAPEFKPKPAPKPASSQPAQPVGEYGDSDAYAAAYEGGTLGMQRVAQEALTIPGKPEGDEPLLPVDLTGESHQEIARLYTFFTNLEARGHWLVSQEEGRSAACAHLEHDAMRDQTAHFLGAMEYDRDKPTHAERAEKEAKAQAESSDAVTIWRARRRQHEAEARSLRGLVAGWSLKRERCSREQTRREKMAGNGG
jgi:hypothetical protein